MTNPVSVTIGGMIAPTTFAGFYRVTFITVLLIILGVVVLVFAMFAILIVARDKF